MNGKKPAGAGKAAFRGAVGCLGLFVLMAVCTAATGGSVYADAGGVVLLLVIGAVVGLITFAIYSKGRKDAARGDPSAPPAARRSVDELVEEAKRLYDEGVIDEREFNRRVRRAWGHRDG